MSRRITYKDEFSGEADKELRNLFCESDEYDDDDDFRIKLRKVLLKVIKNELTPRQTEIIMLYYFKEKNIVEIAAQLGITPQAVSAAMKRARLTIFRYMKYTI